MSYIRVPRGKFPSAYFAAPYTVATGTAVIQTNLNPCTRGYGNTALYTAGYDAQSTVYSYKYNGTSGFLGTTFSAGMTYGGPGIHGLAPIGSTNPSQVFATTWYIETLPYQQYWTLLHGVDYNYTTHLFSGGFTDVLISGGGAATGHKYVYMCQLGSNRVFYYNASDVTYRLTALNRSTLIRDWTAAPITYGIGGSVPKLRYLGPYAVIVSSVADSPLSICRFALNGTSDDVVFSAPVTIPNTGQVDTISVSEPYRLVISTTGSVCLVDVTSTGISTVSTYTPTIINSYVTPLDSERFLAVGNGVAFMIRYKSGSWSESATCNLVPFMTDYNGNATVIGTFSANAGISTAQLRANKTSGGDGHWDMPIFTR